LLEPLERRLSHRAFALALFGVALAGAVVVASFLLLPRGFGLLLLLLIAYPAIQVPRTAWAAHRSMGPRIVIGPTALQAAALRFSWRDVSDVAVGPSIRGRDRRDRVKIRLNRLAPVRPTDAALRAAGLELGDQYFDFAIPPAYSRGPGEIAAEIEQRRAQVRITSAALPAPPAEAPRPAAAATDRASSPRGSGGGLGGRAGAGLRRKKPPT
jgi:hypothetical protein